MKIFIDTIDVSELLLDIKYESDLSGSSRSSIFGSIETEQLELVVKNKHDGERLYIDDEEYAITECDYDEKSERTTVKAITDLRALDDEFELVGGASASEEKVISFKDFELTGNKPNLIPNGWDSFEPYSSGKNYVENWNFNNNVIPFVNYRVTSKIENNQLCVVSAGGESAGILKKDIPYTGDVVVRMKVKAPTGMIYGFTSGGSGEYVKVYPGEGYQIVEGNFKINDLSNQITIYANIDRLNSIKGDNFVMDWIQITPVDNQHLVLEKTPLENGLTRIQTWGGNHRIKLSSGTVPNNVEEGDLQIRSLYVKNLGKGIVRFDQDGGTFEGNPRANWGENEVGHKHFIGTFLTERTGSNSFIRSDNGLPLYFIASDPQIVEGDVPNAVMTVDTLPDGKEEVNIYGARNDTELVYKADAVTGEPYELYGDIDNQGREIKLSSTLGDSHIKKGENQVNLKGDAKNREVAIKIGVA